LLIYAREICEKLDQFIKYDAAQEKTMTQMFQVSKKRKLAAPAEEQPIKIFKKSSRQRTIIHLDVASHEQDDCVEEDAPQAAASKKASYLLDDTAYLRQNEKMLRLHAKKDVAPFYGVPTENEMLARIYRIEWYLSYCRDGWRAPLDHTQMARQDHSLSVWGWREVAVATPSLNSTYYATRYAPREAPDTVFVVSEIIETDEVYHRRYTQVPPLQIDDITGRHLSV
jgi:hypothetical protein